MRPALPRCWRDPTCRGEGGGIAPKYSVLRTPHGTPRLEGFLLWAGWGQCPGRGCAMAGAGGRHGAPRMGVGGAGAGCYRPYRVRRLAHFPRSPSRRQHGRRPLGIAQPIVCRAAIAGISPSARAVSGMAIRSVVDRQGARHRGWRAQRRGVSGGETASGCDAWAEVGLILWAETTLAQGYVQRSGAAAATPLAGGR